jgi:3-oxoacyl-[acyl-carrier protein] reductase
MIHTGLEGKVVLITGGNHGIGAATARAIAAEGAAVLINYLRMPPLGKPDQVNIESNELKTPGRVFYNAQRALTADEVVQTIRDLGGRVEAIEADLAEPSTIPLLFDRAEAAFGPVEVLINNADHCVADTFIPQSLLGPDNYAPAGYHVQTITAENHDRHFAVNSRAVALMMAEYTRRHIERDAHLGRIINVSTDGAACFPGELSYGASKAALESFSRSAAVELGRFGITVNIVSPGPIQTGYITPKAEESLITEIPLRRVGQPEDVADVIVFLAYWATAFCRRWPQDDLTRQIATSKQVVIS